jgi:glycosyltransferase involved in cell wall biosynthesis
VIDVPPLTVTIVTKNEEQFIERCINSVSWADEVLVLDSGSSDRTREIAASLGANVYEQEWLGHPAQRNKAASLAKNDWVFSMDADELVTPELAQAIQETMNGPMNERDGYAVDRRGDIYGLLLPNTSNRQRRRNFVRLYNRRYSGFDPTIRIHEEVQYPGKSILLPGVLIQWRGVMINDKIETFNRNATIEAEILNEQGHRANVFDIFLRPILRFLWNYAVKGVARLGTTGLIYSLLEATYEFIRYAKLWEMQNATYTPHPPAHVYRHAPDPVSATSPQAEEGNPTRHVLERRPSQRDV